MIRQIARYADPLLLPFAVLLVGLGLVMIHRLDVGLTQQAAVNGVSFDGVAAATQVVWPSSAWRCSAVLLGLRDHRTLTRYAYTLALVGLVVMVLPAVLPASTARSTAPGSGSGWPASRSSRVRSPRSR